MSLSREQLSTESGLAVTRWVADLRKGDDVAATRLWKYLEQRLLRLGRRHLSTAKPTIYDEDDLAQSAFHALCDALKNGRYESLSNRGQIWNLLATIVLNKLRNRLVHESALRRGGAMQRADMEVVLDSESSGVCGEKTLQMQEECERLLSALGREEVKQVALLKVEGYTNEEIATALGCSRRTVQRRLDFIRTVWSRELNPS